MKKVLVYMDECGLDDDFDSTKYVVNGMRNHKDKFEIKLCHEEDYNLSKDYDVIFCRFDIPIRHDFLEKLHEVNKGKDKLFLNPPLSKKNNYKKDYLKNFLNLGILPETIISNSPSYLSDFAYSQGRKLVYKPLDENKGRGIGFFNPERMSYNEIFELAYYLTQECTKEMIFQECIDVKKYGDKRINILFYEPVSAVLRRPKEGSLISNVSAGGSMHKSSITKSDERIIDEIMPYLMEHGFRWTGLDIIGPYLGEINKESPGLVAEADWLNGNTKTLDFLIDRIYNY